MNILYLRSWTTLPYSGTFSTQNNTGLGATESQMLAYLKIMTRLGHNVTVYGVSKTKIIEEGVLFCEKNGQEAILNDLSNDKNFEAIFFNVVDGLDQLRNIYPKARFIEICQNGPHFKNNKFVDIYALISHPQFAYYSIKNKKFRNKYLLLPNVPPHETIYSTIHEMPKENQIIWVGSINKQGFYRWAMTMKRIFKDYKHLKWLICVPSYDLSSPELKHILVKFKLPVERTYIKNLNTFELGIEIKKSKILLASLGGEDAGVSYLDGHSLGVPVLCGEDIYGKYYNPEGTGLRCTTVNDCEQAIRLLLDNDNLATEMGTNGMKWIEENLTERHQENSLRQIISFLQMIKSHNIPLKNNLQSDKKFNYRFYQERLQIKLMKYNIFNYFKK